MVAYYEPGSAISLAQVIRRSHASPEGMRRQADAAGGFLDERGWERQAGEFVALYRTLLDRS
jgi:hypothetical protein